MDHALDISSSRWYGCRRVDSLRKGFNGWRHTGKALGYLGDVGRFPENQRRRIQHSTDTNWMYGCDLEHTCDAGLTNSQIGHIRNSTMIRTFKALPLTWTRLSLGPGRLN